MKVRIFGFLVSNLIGLNAYAGPMIGGGPAPVDRVNCLAQNDSLLVADAPGRQPPLINFKMRVGSGGSLDSLAGARATVFSLDVHGGLDQLEIVDENGNVIVSVSQAVGILRNELGESPVLCSVWR